jgi:Trk K+ transport system NAD-binding subunit
MRLVMLVALSDSDLDNLLLCCKARHLFPDACLIARCNDMVYHGIFKETGIQRILTGNPAPDMVVTTVMDALSHRGVAE